MEQTPSLPGRSPELPSVSPPSSQELAGGVVTPEAINGVVVERQERRSESASAAEQAPAPPLVLPTPVVISSSGDDVNITSTVQDDMPTVASDDELIEKEWVIKAKKVIAETKDDPYRREQEVRRLQDDYLSKRYGRQLGDSANGMQ